MSNLVRNRAFLRQMLVISVPVTLQNFISFGLSLMDTMMLGRLGERQISAATIANQPYFIFSIFLFGLASGACVLTAQYWGKEDSAAISRIVSLALRAAVVCALAFGLVAEFAPEPILRLYTSDSEVVALGAEFLRIAGFSYILSAVSTTYLYILRSVESVRFPLLVNFISFLVNTLLNWVFIFGKWGVPAMGIRGSAASALCARAVELLLAVLYARFADRRVVLRLRDFFKVDRLLLRDFFVYSVPVVVNETLWAVGNSMQSLVAGHMGSQVVAANSIAAVVQKLITAPSIGVAIFTAVAVGKKAGVGNLRGARAEAGTLLWVSLLVGAFGCLFTFCVRGPFLTLYHVDGGTLRIAFHLLAVYAVINVFNAFNTVNVVGVLRGGGDPHFAMALDLGAMWLVALPLGTAAGLWWKLPVPAVFLLLMADEPLKVAVGLFRFRSGKWLRNVTREQNST